MDIFDDDIEYIVDCIKIIERQIKYLETKKFLFFHRIRNKEYNERIQNLEHVKNYLYKRLEYKIEKK